MIASFLIAAARATDVFLSTVWPAEADRINALLTDFDNDQPVAVAPEAASSPAGDDPPLASPAGPLKWIDWAVPAILEVLAEHRVIENGGANVWCETSTDSPQSPTGLWIHHNFHDAAEWREHVAPLIAERLQWSPSEHDFGNLLAMRDANQRIAAQLYPQHTRNK